MKKLDYFYDKVENECYAEDEVLEMISDILYGFKNWRESTFIFTLDANEEVGEAGDNYMNCMCVMFNEIMRRPSDG